ncbi:hypothetical protein [Rhizobium sp. BK602]|uniref:hypothetical protein n=1 Tax=Rhizobium sp. BK602 TaxID=2586986 RepID=UPI00160E0345|nr:hypothetical protein [Rhizobium sp. BK602]MBB3610958.1 hypothetical protein [Rhizobium sp. BK602]
MATDHTPILTPTGRGSYVDVSQVSLDDILFSYDRCPTEFIDQPRDSVIAAYHEAWRQIEDWLNS